MLIMTKVNDEELLNVVGGKMVSYKSPEGLALTEERFQAHCGKSLSIADAAQMVGSKVIVKYNGRYSVATVTYGDYNISLFGVTFSTAEFDINGTRVATTSFSHTEDGFEGIWEAA